jgi:hypothetical protein
MEIETRKISSAPDLEGLVDEDILDRFKNSSVFYGDIINAQLIKTNRELTEAINKLAAK